MVISDAGLALIKRFEGLRLKAYQDVVGVWTIGYGSTGKHVKPGLTITESAADALLLDDVERFEEGVLAGLRDEGAEYPKQHEFDALVAFTFNVGLGAWRKSTMLRMLGDGNKVGAADQFLRWNKAGGKVLAGLVKRRAAERDMYIGATR